MNLARPGARGLIAVVLAGCGATPEKPPTVVTAAVSTASAIEVPRTEASGTERRRASPAEGKARVAVDGAIGLFIGQPMEAAERLVGGTVNHVTFDEEREAWESNGYQTDEEPIFAVGFETVSEFTNPTLPVYKLYGARGVVRIIKLSAYVVDHGTIAGRRIGFEPTCFLLAPPESAAETFGTPTFVEQVPAQNRTVFHLVDSGLSVLVEDGRIQVFDVFGRLSSTEERRVREALSIKSLRTRS